MYFVFFLRFFSEIIKCLFVRIVFCLLLLLLFFEHFFVCFRYLVGILKAYRIGKNNTCRTIRVLLRIQTENRTQTHIGRLLNDLGKAVKCTENQNKYMMLFFAIRR